MIGERSKEADTPPRRRRARRARYGLILLLSAVTPFAAHAASEPVRQAKAVRIQSAEAPVIDADLSEPVWVKAEPIDDFPQVEPDTGGPPSGRTVVRILYDEENLYFSVYAYDREPENVFVRTLARDGNLASGDYVRIYLDPDLTRRNGYFFDVNPGGARLDALIQNNAENLPKWNSIWKAAGRRTPDGWTAEIAIPFRSLSYDQTRTEWGFDFLRLIRRRAERDRWTSHDTRITFNDISQGGVLTGLVPAPQGLGLDVQLYGSLRVKHDWQQTDHGTSLSGAGSANAYYRLAQALTATLTVNPDFSDSPLDERQVNTTRFSLFTPETRDFFLQDAANFEFGGRGFLDADNARPFFSRNIGLVSGRPVTILAGGKLSGVYDEFGIGALAVRTNPTRTTHAQTLSAARLTAPVLSESKVGLVVTDGDPTGRTRNRVAGADFQYRYSHLPGDNIVQSDFYYERSFSNTRGDDDSFGVDFNYPNEPWSAELRFKQVGANFFPALGFVNRPAIRDYLGALAHRTRFRGQYLRTLDLRANGSFITGLDDELQSSQIDLAVAATSNAADAFQLHGFNYFENLPQTLSLPRGVTVPPGRYRWTNFKTYIDTTQGRAVVFTWSVECCSFYNGNYVKSDLRFIFRPNEHLEITPRWTATFIDMPTGYVGIHILALDTTVNFTPDMQFILQAQFDNISRNFGLSARYRWEYEPGSEIFAAIGQSASIPGTTFVAQTTQLSVRLGHTFRF